jgi:hypothetical protein
MHKKYAALITAAALIAALAGCSAAGATDASGSSAGKTASDNTAKTSWYDSTYGKFAPVTTKGTSDTVIKLPAGAKGGIITSSYTGSSNFIIEVLDAGNQPTIDGPVNAIGNYKGTTAFGFNSIGNPGTQLKVTGVGTWSITIAPVSSAPATKPATGTGDAVFLYSGPAATWSFTNAGDANFIVNEYSADPFPGIGVNEIGTYSGKKPVNAGPAVVVLESNGAWTIS